MTTKTSSIIAAVTVGLLASTTASHANDALRGVLGIGAIVLQEGLRNGGQGQRSGPPPGVTRHRPSDAEIRAARERDRGRSAPRQVAPTAVATAAVADELEAVPLPVARPFGSPVFDGAVRGNVEQPSGEGIAAVSIEPPAVIQPPAYSPSDPADEYRDEGMADIVTPEPEAPAPVIEAAAELPAPIVAAPVKKIEEAPAVTAPAPPAPKVDADL